MNDESQKPVTQSYRDNWEAIWGKKEPEEPCVACTRDSLPNEGNVALKMLVQDQPHTCGKT